MPVPFSTRRVFAALAALLLAGGAAAAEPENLKFRGYAYDLGSNRFLYTELHDEQVSGDRWLGGTIDYYAPDGTQMGHKTLDFSHDPFIPLYRLDLSGRGGYMEGITAIGPDRIDMTKRGYHEKSAEVVAVKRSGPTAADSGFHSFIRAHFPELLAGQTVAFTFAVAGNLDTYKFRARRLADGTFEGRPVVRFRVEPDSLLRWLVDPLELSYEQAQRKLVEYHGVSNVNDPSTGKPYNVRIIYPSVRPADAPAIAGHPE